MPRILLPLAAALAAVTAACRKPEPIDVIAHRGASWEAPEHTVAAWDLAREQGADWLELDLQRTSDGVLVVIHDDSLDRTARGDSTACRGLVRQRTLAQLKGCDMGSWFNERHPDRARPEYVGQRIQTIDEVLARYAADSRLYIEIKDPESAPGMEEDLFMALVRFDRAGRGADTGRVLVQSFSAEGLRRLHAIAPELALVQLVGDSVPGSALDAALREVASYARGIGPSRRITDRRLVEAAHANGLLIHPYTVDEEAEMSRLLSLGVDGLFTDRPALLRTLFRPRLVDGDDR